MTHMQEEIMQTGSVLSRSQTANREVLKKIEKLAEEKRFDVVAVAARGSSMNAGFVLKNLIETTVPDVTVTFELPSIATKFRARRNLAKTLYVVISQSGASFDTITMLNEAKANGATVVAVTNNASSACATGADFHIDICAGEELAVAATKTFTGEVFAMMLLARAIRGTLDSLDLSSVTANMNEIFAEKLIQIPTALENAGGVMVLSRGITECIAKECGLKLMECCYKFVYTGTTNEFHHGPKALLKENQPVILIAPSGSEGSVSFKDDFVATAQFLRELGAYVVAVTDIPEVSRVANTAVSLPAQKDGAEVLYSAVRIQLLVLSLSLALGLNPDAPRNLRKITVTK